MTLREPSLRDATASALEVLSTRIASSAALEGLQRQVGGAHRSVSKKSRPGNVVSACQ